MTSEWAKQLASEKRAKRKFDQAANEKVLSDRKMVEGGGLKVWSALEEHIRNFVEDANNEMGEICLVVSFPEKYKIEIKSPGSPKTLSLLRFNVNDSTLRVGFHGAELRLGVDSRNDLVWRSTANDDSWTNENVAKKSVEDAWKKTD